MIHLKRFPYWENDFGILLLRHCRALLAGVLQMYIRIELKGTRWLCGNKQSQHARKLIRARTYYMFIYYIVYTRCLPLFIPCVRDRKAIGQGQFGLVFRKPEANGACLQSRVVIYSDTHTRTNIPIPFKSIYIYCIILYILYECVYIRFERKTFYGLIMFGDGSGEDGENTRKIVCSARR